MIDLIYELDRDEKIKTVGFKVLYGHLEHFASLERCLSNIPDLKVIHIRRRNLLKTSTSKLIASKRLEIGKFMNAYGPEEVESDIRIMIDPDKWMAFREDLKNLEEKYAERFRNKEMVDIIYEELTQNRVWELGRMLDFLGVERKALSCSTHKVRQKAISEVIVNFAELRKKFIGKNGRGFLSIELL